MLESLSIRGFKVFDHLEIPELTRLNLFMGSNNAGKSCLLEAIRLFSLNASPMVIRELVRSRDGDWEANIARRELLGEDFPVNVEHPIRYLFHDFHCQDDPSALIEIGPLHNDRTVRISLGIYRTVTAEDGTPRRIRVESAKGDPEESVEEMLEVFIGSERRALVRLDMLWSRRLYPTRFALDELPVTAVSTVGTSGMRAEEIAFLWDQVSLTPQQDRIVECLRLIEPKIEALALIGDAGRSGSGERERIPVIRVEGSRERFPLRTMGDGLTRLFHIALSIVNAQDGVVLIDEFENGLYWEVQEQLWPLIFELAQEFNVQVFATSHSKDCLESFVKAWSRFPTSGSVYRLDRAKRSVRIEKLPLTNVADALASQVEVR